MLTIQNLNKSFGRNAILRGVDLEVPAGSIFALLGPNGSGKTSLLKSVLGAVPPGPESRISLEGIEDINSPEFKRKLVYMPQVPRFPAHLSANEIIGLVQRLRGTDAPFKERLIEELEINAFRDRAFGELSGGMRQKINILQCFMFDFKIALLDEPTASLDPMIASYMKSLLRKSRDRGRTIFFTSHTMAEVEQIADRMALLIDGRVRMIVEPARFVRESGAANLEEALLYFWREHAS